MAPLQSALKYGQPQRQADGTYRFQKNFGRNSFLQYVPYDEWVKTLPAYEAYRADDLASRGGIPEPAGTDVWKDVILPKVAGMAISKGIGLGASSSVPSKVVSGSRGGGGGSLSTGETMEEAGLDALTHSLIEQILGGRGVSQGYTDLPSSDSIASQAKALYSATTERTVGPSNGGNPTTESTTGTSTGGTASTPTERDRIDALVASSGYSEVAKKAMAEASSEEQRRAIANLVAAGRGCELEGKCDDAGGDEEGYSLTPEQIRQRNNANKPASNESVPGFIPGVGLTDVPKSTYFTKPITTDDSDTTAPTVPTTVQTGSGTTQVPQPSPQAPPDQAQLYADNLDKYFGYSESNPGFLNQNTPPIQTPQVPSTSPPTPQGTSTLSQLPGVGLPSGGASGSGFTNDPTGASTRYDTTTDPEYSTSQMDALMASESYNGKEGDKPREKRLGGYNLVSGLSTPRYAVYHNPKNGQSYISYRGTANFGDATGYWGKIIGGDLTKSERFQDALGIYDKVKQKYGTAPRLVGHSLGGSIVKGVVRERPNAIGVGFNAGSSLFGEDKELGKLCAQQELPPSVCDRFIHHRISGDVVSMSAQQATTSNRLTTYGSHRVGLNPIAPHLMDQFTNPQSPYWSQNAPRPTQMTGAYRPRPSLASRYLANPTSFGDPLDNEEGILV
tara:strand:- start:6521 stop:8542 length:2022 start_codon:yes stop_codon:yes gene_type:complete